MKILNELLIVAAFAIFGYIAYKVWQASKAVQTSLASFTPTGIASSVAQDFSDGIDAVGNLFGGSGDPTGTPQGALPNQLLPATTDANVGFNTLVESEMNPYPAGTNFTDEYIPPTTF